MSLFVSMGKFNQFTGFKAFCVYCTTDLSYMPGKGRQKMKMLVANALALSML
jgi:hypothetical protein